VNGTAQGGLTAVTSVLVLLLIAAIFNRIHGKGVNAKGDRIIAGLLALPLISAWVEVVFPKTRLWWGLLASLPLAIYVVLFSLTDASEPHFSLRNLINDSFTLALLLSIGVFYVGLAAYALWGLVVALALVLALILAVVVLQKWIRPLLILEEENKAVAREVVEALNTGDLERAKQFIGPKFVEHGETSGDRDEEGGPELFERQVSMVRKAFPNLQIEIEDEIAKGDKVVQRYTMRGKHEGYLMGKGPTGQSIETSSIHIFRVKGGKVIAHWGRIDLAQIKRQLGAS
jgi:predicted ester cyclase